MKENKFLYSKCPKCGRHGIPAFSKYGRSPRAVSCIYCHGTFKASAFSYILLGIFIITSGYLVNRYLFEFPLWGLLLWVIGVFALGEYFAPLREVEVKERNHKDGSKR